VWVASSAGALARLGQALAGAPPTNLPCKSIVLRIIAHHFPFIICAHIRAVF
jgi:hypothetical protein